MRPPYPAGKQGCHGVPVPSGESEPHFPACAKRMIFIMFDGGLSQVDSYDYKPRLQAEHGKPLPASIKSPKFTFAERGHIIGSPFHWSQWGETGAWPVIFSQGSTADGWTSSVFSSSTMRMRTTSPQCRCSTPGARELRPALATGFYMARSDNSNLPGYVDLTSRTEEHFRPGFFLPHSQEHRS